MRLDEISVILVRRLSRRILAKGEMFAREE